MKRGTYHHPKLALLATSLGVSRAWALGLVEGLVEFTRAFAPRGDVGKFTDAAIATFLDWPGDADALVRALVHAGWLDAVDAPAIRLAVHDWPQHADDAIHRQLARAGLRFWDESAPKLNRLVGRERADAERMYQTDVLNGRNIEGARSGRPEQAPVLDASPAPVRPAPVVKKHVGGSRAREAKPIPTENSGSGPADVVPYPSWDPQGFHAFWSAYPRRENRTAAVASWDTLRPDVALQSVMLDALARLRASPAWRRDDGRTIPGLARFLDERRWLDDPDRLEPPARVAHTKTSGNAAALAEFVRRHTEGAG